MANFNPFENVALKPVNGSWFDSLSHDHKTSFNLGTLTPVLNVECVPGDEFKINVENMVRFAPMLAPVMHRCKIKTQFFFVPNRIIWPEWEEWITGQDDNVQPPIMTFNSTLTNQVGFSRGTIADYLGYPVGTTRNTAMSPLPLYAYYKIYYDYYRDQNFQTDNQFNLQALSGENFALVLGVDTERTLLLQSDPQLANWERDYFTACLPQPQWGDPVLIPLIQDGAAATIVFNPIDGAAQSPIFKNATTGSTTSLAGNISQAASLANGLGINGFNRNAYDPQGTLIVSSGINLVAATINDLRIANVTQEFLERMQRAGTTYKDTIYAHFQTRTKDARLDRAEFIGSISQNALFSETLSTAQTAEAPQANMAGHGISVATSNTVDYKVTEHGWIMAIMYAVPDTAYCQGLHASLTKFDRFQYLWPSFAQLGEQPVYKKEIFLKDEPTVNPDTTNDDEFGYLPIYSDYRYLYSRASSEMRSSLSFWHMARIFETQPSLNTQFTKSNVTTRIFAVEEEVNHIYAHIFFDINAYRLLPKYGIPQLGG